MFVGVYGLRLSPFLEDLATATQSGSGVREALSPPAPVRRLFSRGGTVRASDGDMLGPGVWVVWQVWVLEPAAVVLFFLYCAEGCKGLEIWTHHRRLGGCYLSTVSSIRSLKFLV